ncbi:MAG: hypothetical protein Q8L27_04725 [archaeon]|nr:hypothetical protein [archaeon]
MTFKERSDKFQEGLEALQKEYSMQLYAAQVLLQNGEITTLIKFRSLLQEEAVVDTNKMYDENKPKKGNPISEKA